MNIQHFPSHLEIKPHGAIFKMINSLSDASPTGVTTRGLKLLKSDSFRQAVALTTPPSPHPDPLYLVTSASECVMSEENLGEGGTALSYSPYSPFSCP